MRYVIQRLITTIPVLFFLSIMVFSFIHLIPGNPAEILLGQDATPQAVHALDAQMGLNRPLLMQYLGWLSNVLRGNLGTSLVDHESVSQLILQRLPVTVELAVGTMVVAILIAFPLGIAAVMRGRVSEFVAMFAATIGISVPPFWLGILFLLLFTVKFHLVTNSLYVPIWQSPLKNLECMLLPCIATGIREAAVLLRMLRSSLTDALGEDFVRTAWAKGLRGTAVTLRHALPNALVPVLTAGGLQIAGLLGGLVITEQVFSLPGFGQLLVQSVFSRDYTTVQGTALVAALIVIIVNLLIDLMYSRIDPRIRTDGGMEA
ncbi:MAG: ABC transporter permease [Alicyclobacillus mali]|uniref:ABC transporter permease n=1 Tax=Alicyclobacillus mali (ex Roth et al. 2021) TaxID=1123961 RepID=UPI0023F17460|nr:ABC transporter permease [Alicyclobacillus mali (ex Roth et al. 2021)]MCL6488935.1 ABC transporter permease [Alicyclobacillus mali (ex Roth et al. 2021)]